MTTVSLGGLTIGGLATGVAALAGPIAALSAAHANFAASLSAQLSVPLPTLPDPATLAAAVAAAMTFYNPATALAAATAARVSIAANADAAAAVVNDAHTALGPISAAMGIGGLHAYAFDGSASSAGGELGAALSTDFGSGPCQALVLVTSDPAAWTALGALLRTA